MLECEPSEEELEDILEALRLALIEVFPRETKRAKREPNEPKEAA